MLTVNLLSGLAQVPITGSLLFDASAFSTRRKPQQNRQNIPVNKGFSPTSQCGANPMQDFTHPTFEQNTSLPIIPPAPSVESKALPLEWLLSPKSDTPTERVLARLVCAEAHEPDVWLRDDYRQSFITVALAAKGSPIPFIEASYRMYGVHPDQVWPRIVAQHEAMLASTIPHEQQMITRSPGTGRLVDEEPNADGTSSLPAYESAPTRKPNQSAALGALKERA